MSDLGIHACAVKSPDKSRKISPSRCRGCEVQIPGNRKYCTGKCANAYNGDPDQTILRFVLEEVSSFFERQQGGHKDWNADPYHRRFYKTMEEIHRWWRFDRAKLEKAESVLLRFGVPKNAIRKNGTLWDPTPEQRVFMDQSREVEAKIDEMDQRMLLKAMRIRLRLWD